MKLLTGFIQYILPYLITIGLTIFLLDIIDDPTILSRSQHILFGTVIIFSLIHTVFTFKYRSLLKKYKNEHFFYESLLDALPFPIFYKDLKGIYRYCNKYFENGFQVNRSEIIGKHTKDIYQDIAGEAELADYIYSDIRLLRGDPIVVDRRVLIKDGKEYKFIVFKQLHKNQDDRVVGILGVGYNPDDLEVALKDIENED